MVTVDPARACLTCSCPRLRTYRTTDAYCAACGHPAAQHSADSPDRRDVAPIRTLEPAPAPVPLRAPEPVPSPSGEAKRVPSPIDDEELESGWRAALPSARFVSIAIAAAGAGLVFEGLAMRFNELQAVAPWW